MSEMMSEEELEDKYWTVRKNYPENYPGSQLYGQPYKESNDALVCLRDQAKAAIQLEAENKNLVEENERLRYAMRLIVNDHDASWTEATEGGELAASIGIGRAMLEESDGE